jgi:hypothetical protein
MLGHVSDAPAPPPVEIDESIFAPLRDRRCGVVYIATGESFVEAARLSALSVRRHNPDLPIALFSDRPIEPDGADPFSAVHPVQNPHRRSKVDYLPHSPFERTLYLDADIRVFADLSEIFGVLDRFDVALAHAHARNHRSTNTTWRADIPRAFPQFNGGVIAWQRSEATQAFLRAWRDAYHASGFRKDQVTLRELLWLSDLRIATLPPEYNVRYPKYLWVWRRDEARPKILHMRWFERRGRLERVRDSVLGRLLGAR